MHLLYSLSFGANATPYGGMMRQLAIIEGITLFRRFSASLASCIERQRIDITWPVPKTFNLEEI